MKNNDLVVETFIKVYGIERLLEDLDVRHVHRTNVNQLVMSCPFHDDNQPSFGMNTENGLWNCFGCHIDGNLRIFIRKAYNFNTEETQDFLLQKSGLKNGDIDDLLFMYNLQNLLKEEVRETKISNIKPLDENIIKRMYEKADPYQYLESRGFSKKDINYFQCGFTEHYKGTHYAINERITIPGHDEYGNICGFIGRSPLPNVQPKYLYSADYPKSQTLFNLHRAKKYANKGLIIVEGSLDVMRIHSLGYQNVVAILGSKLSAIQRQLVLKYTDKVYLMCDNDKAGMSANTQALKDLHKSIDVYLVSIPNGKNDPGEITNSDELAYVLNTAKSFNEFELIQRMMPLWKKEL